MIAKARHRQKLLEYLGNPENEFLCREHMPSAIGIKKATLRQNFSPDELAQIEQEALEMRRRKYAPKLSKADAALLEKAAEGDVAAIKLAYQRFEGWKESRQKEHTGPDGHPIQHEHNYKLSPETQEMLDKILGEDLGDDTAAT